MKDTNAIENALKQKIHSELVTLVSKFTTDCNLLKKKYGAESGFYTLKKDSGHSDWKQESSSIRHSELDNILIRMLKAGHGEQMLKIKTKELLNKLELI